MASLKTVKFYGFSVMENKQDIREKPSANITVC